MGLVSSSSPIFQYDKKREVIHEGLTSFFYDAASMICIIYGLRGIGKKHLVDEWLKKIFSTSLKNETIPQRFTLYEENKLPDDLPENYRTRPIVIIYFPATHRTEIIKDRIVNVCAQIYKWKPDFKKTKFVFIVNSIEEELGISQNEPLWEGKCDDGTRRMPLFTRQNQHMQMLANEIFRIDGFADGEEREQLVKHIADDRIKKLLLRWGGGHPLLIHTFAKRCKGSGTPNHLKQSLQDIKKNYFAGSAGREPYSILNELGEFLEKFDCTTDMAMHSGLTYNDNGHWKPVEIFQKESIVDDDAEPEDTPSLFDFVFPVYLENNIIGTAFIIDQDDKFWYFCTCAHVIAAAIEPNKSNRTIFPEWKEKSISISYQEHKKMYNLEILHVVPQTGIPEKEIYIEDIGFLRIEKRDLKLAPKFFKKIDIDSPENIEKGKKVKLRGFPNDDPLALAINNINIEHSSQSETYIQLSSTEVQILEGHSGSPVCCLHHKRWYWIGMVSTRYIPKEKKALYDTYSFYAIKASYIDEQFKKIRTKESYHD